MLRAGVLDDKRADFHRRKESLEKLEKQLADYQALLDEEDREANERLESARLAKAECEEREGAEEDARAAELQTKKKRLVKELGEVDLQVRDSAYKLNLNLNLNLTLSRRWRLHETASPRRRRRGRDA